MRVFWVGIFFLLGFSSAFGQEEDYPVLSKFEVQENEGKVIVDWAFKAGSYCDGIIILHSTDSINFTSISEIKGVCGSFEEERSFYFLHEGPLKNKRNYYRLLFGGFNGNKTLGVQIWDLEKEKNLVLYNIIENQVQIIFKNQAFEKHELTIYSISGAYILTESANTEYFNINSSKLVPGKYLFSINSEKGNRIRGKFILQP